jgi:outer membrane protein insertion porin family/translocation and assembly module TamA
VQVLPGATTGLRLGAGVELDVTRADVHGVLGWEQRTFLGGLRTLAIEEHPSVTLFPTAIPDFHVPTRLLPGHRATLSLRQPGFVEARTVGTLTAEQSIYPVIIPPLNPDARIILGYREIQGAFGPERTFPLLRLTVSTTYHVRASYPFTYLGPLDPELRRVLVSYPDLSARLDLRDDPIRPHAGLYVSGDVQYAGGIFGGDAADVRVLPEARVYVPIGRTVTLATRGTIGLLLPRNYGQSLSTFPPSVHDLQILYFRGFFSGGADSNRGYGLRDIGPHGVAPFYIPGSVAAARARCSAGSPTYDDRLCQVALGGLSLWEASAELRFPILGPLGGVTFVDASDVSATRLDLRIDNPHVSAGVGFRYDTPVGPVRLDIGYRVPGLQRAGHGPEPWVRDFLHMPIAVSAGLGEAF